MKSYFMGNYYEVTGSTVTKYYFAGSQRNAMRKGNTLSYLLSDHLGSTSLTTNASGALVSELRYKAWGETRYSSGTTATNYRYTGQREESSFGLYFFNARWVDVQLGRFVQADSIVPGGVQGLDRYAYVGNSPIRYIDPSGHSPVCGSIYSDPECEKTSKKEIIDPPDEKMAGEVLYNLARGDKALYKIWLTLYQTQAGHELAVYIYEQDVRMEFWGGTSSLTECYSYGCTIHFSSNFMPTETTPSIDWNAAAAELGHEAYHASVWRTAPDGVPVDGGWWKGLLRELGLADAELRDSQWEEAMAYYVADDIYFELTGIHSGDFSDLFVTNVASLQNWIDTYHHDGYWYYNSYPEYRYAGEE